MNANQPLTFLCLASYHKGNEFLLAAKDHGCQVILVTKESLAEAAWPKDRLDEFFLMPELTKQPDITYAVSYLARSNQIDQVIPLDDYDVQTAADLREHMRLPGMGATIARRFRDKLAMRTQAAEHGLPVPQFSPIFNHAHLADFMQRVPPPWVLKPRSEAGAMGIKKINHPDELWHWLNELGDRQSFFLLEQFLPGDVYHVDSLLYDRQIVFSVAHKYGQPPMSVAHEGGVFVTRTLERDSDDARALADLNSRLMAAFGIERGATHAEFIKSQADGQFYFLETAARVGGANIADLVRHATGIDLWAEWARLEIAALQGQPYRPPTPRQDYAGLLICLARQEYPDLSSYQDPEIVWRLHKPHHAGLIVASADPGRVQQLLTEYSGRFAQDFLAVAPPLDKPPA